MCDLPGIHSILIPPDSGIFPDIIILLDSVPLLL